MKNKKISKMASDYFEYAIFFIGIGCIILTHKINKIFSITDKVSYQLYECPDFFLCFVEYIPIVKKISPILKDPFPLIVLFLIFLIILVPIILIGVYAFEIDYKRKEKEDNNK
jgi:hypothetical protein|tara:strand:+ start:305 stop:643 length:339 start_codon:yes stop_codon:yes gene_type:complete